MLKDSDSAGWKLAHYCIIDEETNPLQINFIEKDARTIMTLAVLWKLETKSEHHHSVSSETIILDKGCMLPARWYNVGDNSAKYPIEGFITA